jgi:Flp pilus assembly protein TadG
MSPLQKLSDASGATLVIVATWLPVLVLFATFVLDVGNWFQHKRHLQTQADAGALAAGGSFNACFGGSGGSATVENAARKYAGDPGTASAYNPQVGGSNRGNVTIRINSKTYAAGGPGPDDTVEAPAVHLEDGRRQGNRGRPAALLRRRPELSQHEPPARDQRARPRRGP